MPVKQALSQLRHLPAPLFNLLSVTLVHLRYIQMTLLSHTQCHICAGAFPGIELVKKGGIGFCQPWLAWNPFVPYLLFIWLGTLRYGRVTHSC